MYICLFFSAFKSLQGATAIERRRYFGDFLTYVFLNSKPEATFPCRLQKNKIAKRIKRKANIYHGRNAQVNLKLDLLVKNQLIENDIFHVKTVLNNFKAKLNQPDETKIIVLPLT